MLAKTQILKFYQPHMGKQRPFKGITEPRLPPSCVKEFRGHSKIVKQVKRSRDREPSRLPKKIVRPMKKRKIRCKLKCILRKYTPKSSRLYGLVTHSKLWYVTYLHKCECFFSNFLKLKSLTASKLFQNNK